MIDRSHLVRYCGNLRQAVEVVRRAATQETCDQCHESMRDRKFIREYKLSRWHVYCAECAERFDNP